MYLPDAGGWHVRGVQVLSMKPGNFALGSPESRAAARFLLAARKRDEAAKSPGCIEGLVEVLRAARMRARGEELPSSQVGQETSVGSSPDCLTERIRRARERVKEMRKSQETTT